MRTYHIGIVDGGRKPWGYKSAPGVLEIHVSSSMDYLPPYILEYRGERETTIKELKERAIKMREEILACANKYYPGRNFNSIKVISAARIV